MGASVNQRARSTGRLGRRLATGPARSGGSSNGIEIAFRRSDHRVGLEVTDHREHRSRRSVEALMERSHLAGRDGADLVEQGVPMADGALKG